MAAALAAAAPAAAPCALGDSPIASPPAAADAGCVLQPRPARSAASCVLRPLTRVWAAQGAGAGCLPVAAGGCCGRQGRRAHARAAVREPRPRALLAAALRQPKGLSASARAWRPAFAPPGFRCDSKSTCTARKREYGRTPQPRALPVPACRVAAEQRPGGGRFGAPLYGDARVERVRKRSVPVRARLDATRCVAARRRQATPLLRPARTARALALARAATPRARGLAAAPRARSRP